MKIDVLPADLVEVRLRRKSGRKAVTLEVTIPAPLVRRYNLKDKEDILIAYVGKATEDLKEII